MGLCFTLWCALLLPPALKESTGSPVQEWLTPQELEKLRDEQALEKRIGVYMKAAQSRLDTAESRLQGKSSPPGDPHEFYSVADLVGGTRSALRAAMLNIQDQISYKKARGKELNKPLKQLKETAENLLPRLRALSETALEKRDEPLYRTVRECIEFAESALRGAEAGLQKFGQEEPAAKKP